MASNECRAEADSCRPERECDVVMKGGITSGIVYPRALCELAKRFRLRSLGGTSAGAIAAGCAAAAEYGRGKDGAGFTRLAELPKLLGASMKDGKPRLLSLFQANRPTRGLLAVLLATMSGGSGRAKLAAAIRQLVVLGGWRSVLATLPGLVASAFVAWESPRAILAGLCAVVLSAVVTWSVSYLTWGARRPTTLVVAIVVFCLAPLAAAPLLGATPALTALAEIGLVAVIVGLLGGSIATQIVALMRAVPKQMFGICTGKTPEDSRTPALTDWLHDRIQSLAGKDQDEPLCFGDLHERDIELQVVTTCLTHGRPYVIPGLRRRLYFCPEELAELFPAVVVAKMVEVGEAIVARDRAEGGSVKRSVEHAMMHPKLPLSRRDGIPIVVAVRMSLSFPLLLSAVPLWDYDWKSRSGDRSVNVDARDEAAAWARRNPDEWSEYLDDHDRARLPVSLAPMVPERIWFSDGGISSNFPMHLFDSPVPTRPTVGINLQYHEPGVELDPDERVVLAASNSDGIDEDWLRFASPDADVPGTVAGFMGSIIAAMQNWTDTMLRRVPGYRDRFASVELQANEGGMNLNMPEEVVDRIAGFGAVAGEELGRRFETVDGEGSELNWTSHRWVRLRTALSVFEDWLDGFVGGFDSENEPAFLDLIDRKSGHPPTCYELSVDQREAAKELVLALKRMHAALPAEHRDRVSHGAPRPTSELRVQPRLFEPR